MDCCPYLLLITNDSRVAHQGLHVFLVELCDFGKGELGESFLEIRPLILNHGPVESGNEHRLGQSLEIFSVIFRRFHAPRAYFTRPLDLRYLCSPLFYCKAQLTLYPWGTLLTLSRYPVL